MDTKVCNTCREEKPITEFGNHGIFNGNLYYKKSCKVCSYKRVRKTGIRDITVYRPYKIDGNIVKLCTICNLEKALSEYVPDARRKSGVQSECRVCLARRVHKKKLPKPVINYEKALCETCGIKPVQKYIDKTSGTTYYRRSCGNCLSRLLFIRKFGKEKPAKANTYIFCEESWRDLKICSNCKTPKSFDNFYICKRFGLNYYCNSCSRTKGKKSYEKITPDQRQKLNRIRRETYQSNPEIRKRIVNSRTAEQKKQAQQKRNEKYRQDPEYRKKILEQSKISRQRKIASLSDSERNILLQKRRISRMKRRALEKECLIIIKFSKEEIIKRDGLNCYLCNTTLISQTATIDHILPLSRGGHHKPENAKIACMKCNKSKNSKTLTEFRKWRGDYEYLKQA